MRLEKRGHALIAALLALLLPGLLAAGDNGVKFSRDHDFSAYETYEWVEQKKRPQGSPLAVGGALDTRIRNAIDRQLAAKGFRQAVDEKADFLVAFDGAMEEVQDIQSDRYRIRPGVVWVAEGDINSYRRGTLVISVLNAATGNRVWHAWTTQKVKNPEQPGKQVDKAVKKLLGSFPPKP